MADEVAVVVLQVTLAIGATVVCVTNIELLAVTAVVEANPNLVAGVPVPTVNHPAEAEPKTAGLVLDWPTLAVANLAAVTRSVAVMSSVADKSPVVETLPEESTENWSVVPA